MLLFKIMEMSHNPIIRSNCIIALGDVALRSSHLVDENNNKLYEGLSDKDMMVKKNTLMVLTYLILGSMIKVQGRLGSARQRSVWRTKTPVLRTWRSYSLQNYQATRTMPSTTISPDG